MLITSDYTQRSSENSTITVSACLGAVLKVEASYREHNLSCDIMLILEDSSSLGTKTIKSFENFDFKLIALDILKTNNNNSNDRKLFVSFGSS